MNALDEWVGRHLVPTLREHGFVGGPRLFRRRSGDVSALVQVQASAYNDVGPTQFRVNYGIVHDGVTQALSGRPPRQRGFDINFGQKVPLAESWWNLDPAGADADALATTVVAALDRDVLPFLNRHGSDAGYREYLAGLPGDFAAPYIGALNEVERRRAPTTSE